MRPVGHSQEDLVAVLQVDPVCSVRVIVSKASRVDRNPPRRTVRAAG